MVRQGQWEVDIWWKKKNIWQKWGSLTTRLKYTHTLYIWIKRIKFGQKLPFKNMAFWVSLPDRLYRYLHISPFINSTIVPFTKKYKNSPRHCECTPLQTGQVWQLGYFHIQLRNIWPSGHRCQSLSRICLNFLEHFNWFFKIQKY